MFNFYISVKCLQISCNDKKLNFKISYFILRKFATINKINQLNLWIDVLNA